MKRYFLFLLVLSTLSAGGGPVDDALAKAAQRHHRLIVMYEGAWCTLCDPVSNALKSDPESMKLMASGYDLVRVSGEVPKTVQVTPDKSKGLILSLLETDGSQLTVWLGAYVQEQGQFSVKRLRAFLTEYLMGPKADDVLSAGLTALPEGKAAWVEFRADWCGWCLRMERFMSMSSAKPILGKYYHVISIDTDKSPGSDALAKRLGSASGISMIPWFAILDAKGAVLVTSDGPKGNIGYPDSADEIAHFVNVIKTTARGITDAEIETLTGTIAELKRQAGQGSH